MNTPLVPLAHLPEDLTNVFLCFAPCSMFFMLKDECVNLFWMAEVVLMFGTDIHTVGS